MLHEKIICSSRSLYPNISIVFGPFCFSFSLELNHVNQLLTQLLRNIHNNVALLTLTSTLCLTLTPTLLISECEKMVHGLCFQQLFVILYFTEYKETILKCDFKQFCHCLETLVKCRRKKTFPSSEQGEIKTNHQGRSSRSFLCFRQPVLHSSKKAAWSKSKHTVSQNLGFEHYRKLLYVVIILSAIWRFVMLPGDACCRPFAHSCGIFCRAFKITILSCCYVFLLMLLVFFFWVIYFCIL